MSKMLEEILDIQNMNQAYKKVRANKGASGVDGVTIDELPEYIQENWKTIQEEIRKRKYKPQPVERVEIPKPDGGKRKLGIPTVMDRVIQQAIVQVITPICEPNFSEYSYGFTPNRNCEMGIQQLLTKFNEGYLWVIDIDLEKFFDEVVEVIRDREKPLALYLFTEEASVKKFFKEHISFGGGAINDTLIHFANNNMRFGGVGGSGMGGYHGQYSFKTFSHAKGITEKTTLFDFPFRYPPYTAFKEKAIRFISR